MSESEVFKCIPPEMVQSQRTLLRNCCQLSQVVGIYEAAYKKYIKWCFNKNVNNHSENILLSYFYEMANVVKMKSSTMWSQYTMIKSVLNIKHGVNIGNDLKLRAYLKKQNEGYTPKKAKALTREQFHKFLFDALDEKYLAIKVVLIFGISGACRCDELVRMKIEDIEDKGSLLYIKIPDSKTHKTRSFTIVGDMYRKYFSLLPAGMNDSRFFLKYQNGVCHKMVKGIHTIGSASKEVAAYLKLPNFKEYTGHCLQRTSATLLVDSGARSIPRRITPRRIKTTTHKCTGCPRRINAQRVHPA